MKAVITTIQSPTKAVRQLASKIDVVIIGDAKTPNDYDVKGFVPLQEQGGFKISGLLQTNSYARKNIGYLMAMRDNDTIYETDDDNYPAENWKPKPSVVEVTPLYGGKWINPYKWFSSLDDIWPRGLPLIYKDEAGFPDGTIKRIAPLQQCLVNKNPDVDSIWRMLNKGDFRFCRRDSIAVDSWAPTNSQNTWWHKEAFPLMYLPVYCSMRVTDIWRGLIAQKCLWAMNFDIVFHEADAIQERNQHDLLNDFEQEIPCFLLNDKVVDILDTVSLCGRPIDDLYSCYVVLTKEKILPDEEMYIVDAWLKDIQV